MADQQMTSKEDGTVGVESDELSGETNFPGVPPLEESGESSGSNTEQAEVEDSTEADASEQQEQAEESAEAESGEETATQDAGEQPKFSKALQKIQQDLAAERARNARLEEKLNQIIAGKTAEPAKSEPKPDDEMDAFLADLEKGGDDDVLTPKQLAARLRGYEAINRKRADSIRGEAQAEIGRTQQSTEAVRHEQSWKASNPEIANQYNTLIQKTHEEVRASMPNLDPSSQEYAAAWHLAHKYVTKTAKEQLAKVAPKSSVAPKTNPLTSKPSTGPRKPVPSGAGTVAKQGKIAASQAPRESQVPPIWEQADPSDFIGNN